MARHQRGRLEGAMIEAVSRHGYGDTTLQELVTLAGVSKATFYEHFESKQDCFLCAFDDIIDEIGRQVSAAFEGPGSLEQRLVAALERFTGMAVEERGAAHLAAVESLTLGAAAVPHRDRAAQRFEHLIRATFDQTESEHEVSDLTVRGIVAGIRTCLYRRMRTDTLDELPEMVDPLAAWVLRYDRPPCEEARRAAAAAAVRAIEPSTAGEVEDGGDLPGWGEPPDSPLSRETLGQRERIIRAAARVGVEKGYGALSIPAISTAAAVSNQTFYEHFPGKREAFLAAFDALASRAMETAAGAFAETAEREDCGRPEAIGVGLRALLDHISGDPLFARLAFFEIPTAGPAALDHADNVLGAFTAYLEGDPGGESAGTGVPKVMGEVIGGGIWAIVQHAINTGELADLPARAPQIAEFTVTPLGG